MRDASGHSLLRGNHGLWQQQVHLSRGHWRREDAAGAIRSAGWWESVTVTWSPAPAPDRRPAMQRRALAAAGDMIATVSSVDIVTHGLKAVSLPAALAVPAGRRDATANVNPAAPIMKPRRLMSALRI